MISRTFALVLLCISVCSGSVRSAQSAPNDALAREIYKELIEINTTDTPAGSVTKAAEAMAARLKAAGFADADVRILAPAPRKGNLIARLKGNGKKRPI